MEHHVTVHVEKYHQNAPQEALPHPEVSFVTFKIIVFFLLKKKILVGGPKSGYA